MPAPMPQPCPAWAELVGTARPPASVTTASAAAILDLMVMMVSLWNACGPIWPSWVLVGPGGKRFNAAGASCTWCAKSHRRNFSARSHNSRGREHPPPPSSNKPRWRRLLPLGLLFLSRRRRRASGGGVGLPRHNRLIGVDQARAVLG